MACVIAYQRNTYALSHSWAALEHSGNYKLCEPYVIVNFNRYRRNKNTTSTVIINNNDRFLSFSIAQKELLMCLTDL